MIGYYNYTVILTYIGALFGFGGIIFINEGNLKMALVCLFLAGFCDMFDGKIASTKKRTPQEKRFGIQIDSLSDLVSFGVLPALIVLNCSEKTIFSFSVSALFLLCALIRLAWFNVDEEERQNQTNARREFYLGLPVTSTALLLPLFIGLAQQFHLPLAKIGSWWLLIIAAAFLLPFQLKKPKLAGITIMLTVGIAGFIIVLTGGSL